MKRELRNLGKKMHTFSNDVNIRVSFHRLRKEFQKTLKETKHKFFSAMIQKLDDLHENNPKMFWETIDKLKGISIKQNPISISDWHTYMSDLYESNHSDIPYFDLTSHDLSEVGPLDFPFNCAEVRKGILKLKNNKQPGIDLVPNEFMKYGINKLLLPIVNLFNRLLTAGKFPMCWTISCTTFIHKNGDINNCDNYRCIGLTSCFGKFFTSLLQNRLHRFLEDEHLYNRFQAGFRPDYRTTDHIFTIKTILNKYLYKNKKQVFACFVDFSKAFDSLSHEALFQKYYTLGIKGNFFSINL